MNNCTFMGRLTRDVETRTTQSGKTVAKFGLAVDSYAGKDRDGKAKKRTCFLDCEAWERTAENLAKHFRKGSPIMVEGELVLDQWDDSKTGEKRSKHKLNVGRFYFLLSDGTRSQPEGEGDEAPSRGTAGDVPF